MPLSEETERALRAIAGDVRQRVAALGIDPGPAIRRLARMLTAPDRAEDRDRVKERARLVAAQGGRCAVCFVSFATSPAATRGKVTDRLLCAPCARSSTPPAPPR